MKKHKDFHRLSGTTGPGCSRGELGRGARFRREEACRDIRDTYGRRHSRAFGSAERHQRGGLSLPEAGPHRLRLDNVDHLHAPVPHASERPRVLMEGINFGGAVFRTIGGARPS